MLRSDLPSCPRMTEHRRVHRAASLDEALERLADEPGAQVLAGGTWVMGARLRGEDMAPSYVSLAGIPSLREIATGGDAVALGALVTHAQLAAADLPPAL